MSSITGGAGVGSGFFGCGLGSTWGRGVLVVTGVLSTIGSGSGFWGTGIPLLKEISSSLKICGIFVVDAVSEIVEDCVMFNFLYSKF